jgi:hypothetical protein
MTRKVIAVVLLIVLSLTLLPSQVIVRPGTGGTQTAQSIFGIPKCYGFSAGDQQSLMVTYTGSPIPCVTAVSQSGLTTLNGLNGITQTIAADKTGTDTGVSSAGNTHTIHIPEASATATGTVNTGAQTFAGNKTFQGTVAAQSLASNGSGESSVYYSDNGSPICTASAANQGKICSSGNRSRVSDNQKPYQNLIERLPERREAMVLPSGSNGTNSYSAVGEGSTVVNVTNSSSAPTDTEPFLWNQITAATNGSIVSLNGNSAVWRTGKNIYFVSVEKLSQTTNERFWVGLTTAASAGNITNVGNSDSLISATGGPFRGAAFRYSTGASDTEWKCITSDGTTQNVGSSGVAITTGTVILEIREDVANSKFYFYINHSLVYTATSNLPGSGGNVNLEYLRSLTTLTTGAATVGFGGMRITEDIP